MKGSARSPGVSKTGKRKREIETLYLGNDVGLLKDSNWRVIPRVYGCDVVRDFVGKIEIEKRRLLAAPDDVALRTPG